MVEDLLDQVPPAGFLGLGSGSGISDPSLDTLLGIPASVLAGKFLGMETRSRKDRGRPHDESEVCVI